MNESCVLRHSKIGLPMSALCQKRTFRSAIPLLLDRLQQESLEIGVAHDAVIPGRLEAHDLSGAIEIDGNDAALYRASVVRPLEAAALIATNDVHEL